MKTPVAAPAQRKTSQRSNKKTTKSPSKKLEDSEGKETKPWEEVRRDKVARAKKLLEDANYPSPEVIRSVAGLLARDWDKRKNS